MMENNSNVYDDRPNTNDSLDGVILTDATKEAYAKIWDQDKVAK